MAPVVLEKQTSVLLKNVLDEVVHRIKSQPLSMYLLKILCDKIEKYTESPYTAYQSMVVSRKTTC